MKSGQPRSLRAVPTLTEVLEPSEARSALTAFNPLVQSARAPISIFLDEAPPASMPPSPDDGLEKITAEIVERCLDELRMELKPRVETLVREVLARRLAAEPGEA